MKWPEDFLGKVLNADCLDVMRQMPDKCVDMVFTSPPYNIARKRNDTSNRPMFKRMSDEWYDDQMPREEYLKWQKSIIRECIRICSGSVFYNHKIIYAMSSEGEVYHPWEIVGEFKPKCEIIWDRCGGLYCGHERVIVIDERIYQIGNPAYWDPSTGMTNIWRVPPEKNSKHPCPFPLELPRKAMQISTKPGMIIFDPFGGSGTTALSAEASGRRWVIVEKRKDFCDIARKRIDDEKRQGKLF